MITIKNGTKLDEDLISHILNPSKPNIKFHNITFDCETIEDASGNVFVWACKRERKRGEWIHGKELSRAYIGDACVGINYEDFHCSACNVVIEKPCKPTWNYCPNCGAEMRGEEDGE